MAEEPNPLPSEMWKLAEQVTEDEGIKLLHAQIVARLREELPSGDTLQLMMLERVATLYVTIRAKEMGGTFAHDRSYKETLQLWAQMSGDLRKGRATDDAVATAVSETLSEVAVAIHTALQGTDLPNDVRIAILESVSTALEE